MESKATVVFAQGFNCAQSVLGALSPELDRELAMKLTSGLGGGCGRQGELCGALTGAAIAIGLRLGSPNVDAEAKARTYECVAQLFEEFRERHGAVRCQDLLGCDLSTAEGRDEARARGVLVSRCPRFVHDAAAISERLLRR